MQPLICGNPVTRDRRWGETLKLGVRNPEGSGCYRRFAFHIHVSPANLRPCLGIQRRRCIGCLPLWVSSMKVCTWSGGGDKFAKMAGSQAASLWRLVAQRHQIAEGKPTRKQPIRFQEARTWDQRNIIFQGMGLRLDLKKKGHTRTQVLVSKTKCAEVGFPQALNLFSSIRLNAPRWARGPGSDEKRTKSRSRAADRGNGVPHFHLLKCLHFPFLLFFLTY